MNPIPHTPETDALARRLLWFEDPAEVLADPVRFLAYAFEAATHEDMALLRRYLTEADFRAALAAAPPGQARDELAMITQAAIIEWLRRRGTFAVAPLRRNRNIRRWIRERALVILPLSVIGGIAIRLLLCKL